MAATAKITITLPKEQLRQVKALVASGAAANVSAFVKHAVDNAIQDDAAFGKALDEALERTGGPLTEEERVWAESILSGRPTKSRSRKRKVA